MYERARRDVRSTAQRRSAEPPLHAVLALQRAAGNQATSRMLARAMVKAGTIGNHVKRLKSSCTTSAELELEILKAIGGNLTKQSTTVAQAHSALLGKKIDQEDVTAISNAAKQAFGEKTEQATKQRGTLLEDIELDRTSINATYGRHVFYGDFNKGVPTGFHHKGQSTTHEAYGDATPTQFPGVYEQSVRTIATPHKYKDKQSTFFPDAVPADDVIAAIATVYGEHCGYEKVRYPKALEGLELHKIGTGTVMPGGGQNRARLPDPDEKKKK